jgi:capsular polysaccharide biosynthesis protein
MSDGDGPMSAEDGAMSAGDDSKDAANGHPADDEELVADDEEVVADADELDAVIVSEPVPNGAVQASGDDEETAVITLSSVVGSAGVGSASRFWGYEAWHATDAPSATPSSADTMVGLVNLGFIGQALKRTMAMWCALAVVGLVVGFGVLVAFPPSQQAQTSLILASPPDSAAGEAVSDDQGLITSRTVAELAMKRLGLHESVATFLAHYTATTQTDEVLDVTVSSKSAATAITEANVLATTFLAFQANMINEQNQLLDSSYQQQINAAQQQVAGLKSKISALDAQPGKHAAAVSSLQADLTAANNSLGVLESTVASTEATNQTSNEAMIADSRVLDKAFLLKQSRKRALALYAGGGLVAGLALGMTIAVIGALVSSRLRRRDDVARVLGAPVTLSVGKVRHTRRPGPHSLEAMEDRDVLRIAAHLGSAVVTGQGGLVNLAVVPVDDVQVPAVCLLSLASSCASQGLNVVVADLCPGAPLARMLRAAPGVSEVSVRGGNLTLIVPEHDTVPMVGPLAKSRWAAEVPEPVATACEKADVLLTLAWLDPALGADHLPGWATSVVVMVTAGQSSATRVYAVGEMLRMVGRRSVSAVLLGADSADESLGVTPGQPEREPVATGNGLRMAGPGYLTAADADLAIEPAGPTAIAEA